VNVIDKQGTQYQFGHTLINIAIDNLVDFLTIDNLVDFLTKLVGNFRFLGLAHGLDQTQNILFGATRIGMRIGHVQVMKRDILNDLFIFMHIAALPKWHALFGFQIKFRLKGINPSNPSEKVKRDRQDAKKRRSFESDLSCFVVFGNPYGPTVRQQRILSVDVILASSWLIILHCMVGLRPGLEIQSK
jgi:hypothetical protein